MTVFFMSEDDLLLLKDFSENLQPNLTKTAQQSHRAISTLHDRWQKLKLNHLIQFEIVVDGRNLKELLTEFEETKKIRDFRRNKDEKV